MRSSKSWGKHFPQDYSAEAFYVNFGDEEMKNIKSIFQEVLQATILRPNTATYHSHRLRCHIASDKIRNVCSIALVIIFN
jgi:hypothetical protein